MLKWNEFLWIFFLHKRFSEKYEHIELVLNFVGNSILVKETHFHPILVELEHHDEAKSCF